MNTKLPDVQDALYAAIAAQSPTCRVSLGYPVGGRRAEDVWVGIAGRVDTSEYMTGACSRDEQMEVPVFVWVEKSGGTAESTRDRAVVLLGALETALAADRTLGGVCDFAAVSAVDMEDGYTEKTVAVGITATVTVRATSV